MSDESHKLWNELVTAEAQSRKQTLTREPDAEPYMVDAYKWNDGSTWVRLEHAQQVVRYTHDEAWRRGQWAQMKEDRAYWEKRLVRRTQITMLCTAGMAGIIVFILLGYFSQ